MRIFSAVILSALVFFAIAFTCLPASSFAEAEDVSTVTTGTVDGNDTDVQKAEYERSFNSRIVKIILGIAGIAVLGTLFTILILRKKPVEKAGEADNAS